jgi:methyl-accepting chemotaxis protein
MIDAIQGMTDDAGNLAKAAVEGRLTARADVSQHQGEFRRNVQGVNDTLDAIALPLRDVGQALETLAAGDLSMRINNTYQGAFEQLKTQMAFFSLSDVGTRHQGFSAQKAVPKALPRSAGSGLPQPVLDLVAAPQDGIRGARG